MTTPMTNPTPTTPATPAEIQAADLTEIELSVEDEVMAELAKAMFRFGPMKSAHEGYAVLLEELNEAWDEIKANDTRAMQEEMIQVAAMAMRFLHDVCEIPLRDPAAFIPRDEVKQMEDELKRSRERLEENADAMRFIHTKCNSALASWKAKHPSYVGIGQMVERTLEAIKSEHERLLEEAKADPECGTCDKLMTERDEAVETADNLADAIASHFGFEIGEHSNCNCPWTNALNFIKAAPEFKGVDFIVPDAPPLPEADFERELDGLIRNFKYAPYWSAGDARQALRDFVLKNVAGKQVTSPETILECAEGMAAYEHGSDGFKAYRDKLCGLLGLPVGTDVQGVKASELFDSVPSPVAEPVHKVHFGLDAPSAVAPQVVAGSGVVEGLKMLIQTWSDFEEKAPSWAKAKFTAALDSITKLPEVTEPELLMCDNIVFRKDKDHLATYSYSQCSANDYLQLASLAIRNAALLTAEVGK